MGKKVPILQATRTYSTVSWLHDFRLLPQYKRELHSSGMLCGTHW